VILRLLGGMPAQGCRHGTQLPTGYDDMSRTGWLLVDFDDDYEPWRLLESSHDPQDL